MASDIKSVNIGNDLMFFMGTTSGTSAQVAFSKNASLDIETDVMEASSKESGNSKEYIAGRTGWNGSTDGLVAYNTTGATALTPETIDSYRGATVYVKFGFKKADGTLDTAKKYYAGKAILKTISINASENELTKYTISLQGTGDLLLV